MSYAATIKLAPVFTAERFNDPAWARPGRTMYDPGSLRFLPSETSIPLLLDHEEDKVIGRVHRLWQCDWVDGPWLVADATVDVEPTHFLARGAKASCETRILHRRNVEIGGTCADVVASAFLREVSILSPSLKPREPLAEVLLLTRSPAARSTPEAGEVIIHPPGTRVQRFYPNAVVGVR